MAHYIVDVHNLLYERWRKDPSGNYEYKLNQLLKEIVYFSDFESHQVTLVFDGTEKIFYPFVSQKIECIFSGSESSADHVIEKLLPRLTQESNATVISDDHELQNAAISRGLRYLSTRWFVKAISKTS